MGIACTMKPALLVILCLALASLQSAAAKPVIALGDADFSQQTSNGEWLVKFYAPWCSACKKLAPTYAGLPDLVPGVNVAEVDIDQSKELAAKFGVTSIPAVKFISDGGSSIVPYTGNGKLEDLKSFVATHSKNNQNSVGTSNVSDPGDSSVRGKLTRFIQTNPLIAVSAAPALGTVLGALAGATIALKEKEAMPNTPTWMARASPGRPAGAGAEEPHLHND